MSSPITAWAVPGIGEITPGDDLAAIIGDALETDAASHPENTVAAGDILVVTSKILSKAEGRIVAAVDREQAITDETVRVVATRAYDGGVTRIVENRQGVVGAAAGVDASNVADGHVLLLPQDPDASAAALTAAFRDRFGVPIGVIVSDTLGRAWRLGQTDIAIGAAGLLVVDDLRGQMDATGKPLAVTQPAVGDELAALGDLVKGKASGCPVAVVRGAARFVTRSSLSEPSESKGVAPEPFTTARSLARIGPTDMFRLGTDEALAEGYRRGLVAGLALAAGAPPRWSIVIPFKGGVSAKSRFASAFGADRQRIALAFLRDTVAAVADVDAVDRVIIVSAEPLLHEALLPFEVEVVADPGGGLNAAVAAGVARAQNLAPESFAAVLVGDLPALKGADLAAALDLAVEAARGGHPLGFVADRDGTGTTAVMAAPGVTASTRFGLGSRQSHTAAGFVELAVPDASSLHLDIDDAPTLDGVLDLVGPLTRAELARIEESRER